MMDFLSALGLLLVIEGLFYAALPHLARQLAARAAVSPDAALRSGGLFAALLGLAVLWLLRH